MLRMAPQDEALQASEATPFFERLCPMVFAFAGMTAL